MEIEGYLCLSVVICMADLMQLFFTIMNFDQEIRASFGKSSCAAAYSILLLILYSSTFQRLCLFFSPRSISEELQGIFAIPLEARSTTSQIVIYRLTIL